MNSDERKELRYQRRKQKRIDKLNKRNKLYCDLDNIFVFHRVLFYSDKCCNGVRWKKSTKIFIMHQFTNIACTCYGIKNQCYKVGKTYNFVLNERGKIRNINAPYISDRLVHKVISNEVLMPLYEPYLIYDNGASQLGKGFIFALNRLKYILRRYYKCNGYVVLVDYSKFFPNCSHEVIHNIHKKYISNEYTIKVIEDYLFVSSGIALGVEISQREASIIPNKLDHYILSMGYPLIRYMDDSIFIVDSYDKALKVLDKYIIMANELGISVNMNKTKVIKINEYFKYCKWNFKVFDNGKVIMVPDKSTIYRQRRKLKKLIMLDDIDIIKACFKAYLSIGNSYKYIKYINKKI